MKKIVEPEDAKRVRDYKDIKVGMGATEILWSDRHAFTVIEKKSPTRIIVRRDKAVRTDKNGMSDSQSYDYYEDLDGVEYELIKTKKGWKILKGSTYFAIGYRDEYFDFSF